MTALAVLAGVWLWRYFETKRRERNWPKLIPMGTLEVLKGLQGMEQPLYLLDLVRKYGSIFRVRFPFVYPLLVVSDVKVYRAIAVRIAASASSIQTTMQISHSTCPGVHVFSIASRHCMPLSLSHQHVFRRKVTLPHFPLKFWIIASLALCFCKRHLVGITSPAHSHPMSYSLQIPMLAPVSLLESCPRSQALLHQITLEYHNSCWPAKYAPAGTFSM